VQGHVQTESFRSLKIYNQFEFRWRLNREIAWFFAFQNAIDISRRNSDRISDPRARRLSAKCCREQAQQITPLFDHLVCKLSSQDEGLRPSALAVLRLIASSNLVGCWIGSSSGLAPLRMRSMLL
jgi:hypothetical protein